MLFSIYTIYLQLVVSRLHHFLYFYTAEVAFVALTDTFQ